MIGLQPWINRELWPSFYRKGIYGSIRDEFTDENLAAFFKDKYLLMTEHFSYLYQCFTMWIYTEFGVQTEFSWCGQNVYDVDSFSVYDNDKLIFGLLKWGFQMP